MADFMWAARDTDGHLQLFSRKPVWDGELDEWRTGQDGLEASWIPLSMLWEIKPGECYEVTLTVIGDAIEGA